MNRIIIITGVSGSGKTTVGRALARRLGYPFYEGDDFHPPQNIAKMAGGIPLDDADRAPWLDSLHALIAGIAARGESAVLACSALKEKYRERLARGVENVCFVYLYGSFDLIRARILAREEHYFEASMLRSQFEALEPPAPGEAISVSVHDTVEGVVDRIKAALE